MSGPLVELKRDGGIAHLVLNRPERHNALVPELLDALLHGIRTLRADPPTALILSANGPSFSTGGDVGGFYAHRNQIEPYATRLVGLLNDSMLEMLAFPAPTVCAVHSRVCGGSLGLLLAADRILMTPDATITAYYKVVGFSPDGGWDSLLPKRIGLHRARTLIDRNYTITAHQAQHWGLVMQVAEGELEKAARATAQKLCQTGTPQRPDLQQTRIDLESERQAFVQQIQTQAALKGMQRYLRKAS